MISQTYKYIPPAGRIILHSDMNSFYASVETLLYPELKNLPVAVCGSTEDRHGIILAKSEAAKKAGVKTGMVNFEALRLCPGLILRPPRYDRYLRFSKLARSIYERYTDQIESFGMDESWLDVTGSVLRNAGTKGAAGGVCSPAEAGAAIAEDIRKTISRELGLTVSIGVSWNKIFAKLGSDMKKPDAVTVISPENYKSLVWPLDAGELLYVGRATSARLRSVGIRTIGDLAGTDPLFLKRLLGVNGLALHKYAAGLDDSRVMHKDTFIPPESVGHGVTCVSDLISDEEVHRVILELTQDIGHRLRGLCCLAGSIRLFLRDSELSCFSAQASLPQASRSPAAITECAYRLFKDKFSVSESSHFRRIRQVTVTACSLVPDTFPVQTCLFSDQDFILRREKAEAAVDEVRRRFGNSALYPASLMLEKKIPHDSRHLVHMPGPMYH